MPRAKKPAAATVKKAASASEESAFLGPAALIAHLNKKFGANTLVRASDASSTHLAFIPTGNAGLDIGLGGGLVEGRVHQFRGGFSSTKTTHLHSTAKEFLSRYPEAVYVLVDAENTTDESFLRDTFGFDDDMMDRTFTYQPSSGEEAGDVIIEAVARAAKVIVGVDSVDALTPTAEIEGDMGTASVAPGARMMNKFIRKLVPMMRTDLLAESKRTTVILLSQLREKIGGMTFQDSSVTWGGKGKEFAASTIVKFARVAWLRQGDKKDGLTYGMRIQADIIKCKGPGHGESVECDYYKARQGKYLPGEFGNIDAVIEWGIRLGVVKKTVRKLTYGTQVFETQAAFIDALFAKSSLRIKLTSAIMEARKALYSRRK